MVVDLFHIINGILITNNLSSFPFMIPYVMELKEKKINAQCIYEQALTGLKGGNQKILWSF